MAHRFAPILCFLAALVGLTPNAGSQQPVLAQAELSIDEAVRARVGLTAYTIQSLAVPDAQGGFARFEVSLGGRAASLEITLDPVDAPDCTMFLDDGSGSPQVVPAPAPCTYRGSVAGQIGSVVSGSIIHGQFTGIVILPGEQGAWNILPLDQAWPGAERSAHIVSRFEDSVAGNWRCGVTEDGPAIPALATSGNVQTSGGHSDLPNLCELAVDADYPYFQLVGGTASTVAQDIATVVANASSYAMLSGCNLRFRVVRYVIRVSPAGNPGLYNTNDPTTLLQGEKQVWTNLGNSIPRDLTHLFTGRDLGGLTIGIAYIGGVCSTNSGYALNQSRFTLQPGRRAAVLAHEIGHNFTAHHCDDVSHACTPCWIMSAAQGSTTNQLTRYGCSTDVIVAFIPTRNCIGPGDAPLQGGVCAADFDRSGSLSAHDFAAFASAVAAQDPRADIDGSGRLDVNDYVAFLAAYSRGCP